MRSSKFVLQFVFIQHLLLALPTSRGQDDDMRRSSPIEFRNASGVIQPTYLVIAPRIVRPDSVYRIAVTLLPDSADLVVKALITRGRHHVGSASEIVDSGSSQSLQIKIPPTITDGQYRLKLEGFDLVDSQRLVFSKEGKLQFHPDFLSILVQSNRKVFRNEMQVKFRVVLTQMDLKPYADPVTVYMLDPEGFVMRRWPSCYPRNGVVALVYRLPAFPREGAWTIRVEAMSQHHNHTIYVERYYARLVEILPSAPAYVLESAETYPVSVGTSFHSGRVAQGNITIRLLAKPINSTNDFQPVLEEQPPWSASFVYDVQLNDVKNAIGLSSLTGWQIRAAIELDYFFMGEKVVGYIETRVIQARVKLRFTGTRTAVFKPGMPFAGNVYVMYDDGQAIEADQLAQSSLTLKVVVTTTNGQLKTLPEVIIPRKGEYVSPSSERDLYHGEFQRWMDMQLEDAEYEQFRTTGVYRYRLLTPKDSRSMRITALYQHADGDEVATELQSIAFYSPQDFHAHLSTSTEQGTVGEYAVFHLRSDFSFQFFSYVIVSKAIVVHGAHQSHPHPTKLVTFSVPVSTEMSPSFKVVVTILSPVNELVADSVTVPVRSINRYKFNVTAVQAKDHSKQTVQLVTRSHPGAFIGLSILRSAHFPWQADNELTASRMLKSLYKLEPFARSVHGVTWTDRQGMKADRSEYYVGANPGPDIKRTVNLAGLLVFTDSLVTQYPDTAACERGNGFEPCLAVGCYHRDQRCNGNADCVDGSDEDDCPADEDDQMLYRIFRKNRYHDFYDWLDGDWAWYDIPVTDDGIEFHDRPVTQTNEVWYINAFSFHGELGFAVLDDVIEYDGSPMFYFTVESPSSVRRGETLSIRLLIINNMDKEQMALIILEASDDYCFVETGPEGEVEHYRPSLVQGERHHMVTVKAFAMTEVYMPIAPLVEQGTITIKIRTLSQIHKQTLDVDVEILPEGVTITRHTSLMLDLKNRANVLRFLDIPVEETPIIPYSKFRRYVFGSPRASVCLCGDVFGPVFPSTPVSTASFLGRSLRGTEANLFNLATTSWSLHYLRLTNQLRPDVLYSGLDEMNVQLADLMRLYDVRGSFQPHTKSGSSVWLTAWVLRVLGQSQFQDWENNYLVDRRLLASCVEWLLGFQSHQGAFEEVEEYSLPLDRRLAGKGNASRMVGHTAHVLIGLSKASDSLDGKLKVATALSKGRAVNYLERVLSSLTDPYEVSIVSYALTLANSPVKETAFGKLHNIKREDEGMVYWSRNPVEVNQIVYENQRPFLQPRPPTDQDAVAVEASAYALLVYLARDGIGDLQERVVTWLNTMRMVDGGFVSIFDTIVAMEALTEYAYRARLRDITDMSVLVEASASSDATQLVRIQSDNLATVHTMDIPNVWGHVNVIGRGAGQAVMQLKVQYGVDWEELRNRPSRPYFDLYVEETYSHFRNKSHITVDACVKWLATDESPTSGAVTVEVEMPSGYNLVQSDANERLKEFDFLRDVLVANDRVVWMMDKVGPERLCFSYLIKRWFPVANMTMYRAAIVYESHSPNNFEMQVFNATPLYVLDICEVCGSYQCPYCPYFSSTPSVFASNPVSVAMLLSLVYCLPDILERLQIR